MIPYKQYLPLLLIAVLAVLSFLIVKPLLIATFLGALLAYAFFPVYRFISRRTNGTFASLLICVLVLLVLLTAGIFFVRSLVTESSVLYLTVKQKLAVGVFRSCDNEFCNALKGITQDPDVNIQVREFSKTITDWVNVKGQDFLFSLPRLFLNIFILFFMMFYFLKDGKVFMGRVQQVLNLQQQKYAYVTKRLREVLPSVVYGYLLMAFIQGAFGALGFYLFGISSPLFWGVVMFMLALIPYIGTGLVWIPAAIMLVLEGIFQNSTGLILKGGGLFVYGLIFVASIDNFLKPKIIGEKAKVHPAIILLGTIGGVFFFGVVGVLLGPILLSLTLIMLESYFWPEKL